jgi:hypothetical protein
MVFETDCPAVIANITAFPFGASQYKDHEFTRFDISTLQGAFDAAYLLEDSQYEPFVTVVISPIGTDEICGRMKVRLVNQEWGVNQDAPRLISEPGSAVVLDEVTDDDDVNGVIYSLEFSDIDEDITLSFEWPGLYEYSHQERGLFEKFIGERSSKLSFSAAWIRPEPEDGNAKPNSKGEDPIRGSVWLHAESPLGFNAVESTMQPDEMNRDFVTFKVIANEDLESFGSHSPLLTSTIRFRSTSFEAKQNFVLLVGGAFVGLGLTFIVETLIALILWPGHQSTDSAGAKRGTTSTTEENPEGTSKPSASSDGDRPTAGPPSDEDSPPAQRDE